MSAHRHRRVAVCCLLCLLLLCALALSDSTKADSRAFSARGASTSLTQGTANGQLPPLLPSAFWGKVCAREGTLTEETPVTVWIGSNRVAQTKVMFKEDEPYYSLDVPPDDPQTPEVDGGMPEGTVRFKVGDLWATEQSTWHTGATTRCDLSANSCKPLMCPLVLKR